MRAENEVNDDTRGHAFLSKVPLVGQAMKIISNFEPTTVMPNMYRHGKNVRVRFLRCITGKVVYRVSQNSGIMT
jgi:hypothetical protein